MMPHSLRRLGLAICLCPCLWAAVPDGARAAAPDKEAVTIGIADTMVVDVPRPLVELLAGPFGSLMKEFTGLEGKLKIGGEPLEVARALDEKKLGLGVFQGIEFAWARHHYPDLQPLMVAVYKQPKLHATLVVRKDGPIASFADLRGKEISLPCRSKEHCRLFLERHCHECGMCVPQAYFGQVVRSLSTEDALDDLVLGKIHAAVIDKVSLDFYQYLKPGAFARLKVAKESEAFPPAVVAYRKGALAESTLNKFKDGMLRANKNQRGQDMMGMWRISSFETVPQDYHRNLAEILKAYPAPEAGAKVSRR